MTTGKGVAQEGMRMRRVTHLGALGCVVVAAVGCTSGPRIGTAADLIAQLQRAGVPIDSQEPAPMPTGQHFRFDEGIRIKGPGMVADVLRIEDRRVFDLAKSAGRMLVVTQAVAGQELPDAADVYARHPFVIAIREQPEGSNLKETLARLLPPEPE